MRKALMVLMLASVTVPTLASAGFDSRRERDGEIGPGADEASDDHDPVGEDDEEDGGPWHASCEEEVKKE